jgi:hypothetical protein
MHRITLLLISLLAVPFSLANAQQRTTPQPQTPASTPHDTVRGAVRAIDVRTRTVEVSTGVGYALRVVRLQVPASVPITDRAGGENTPLKLAELKLGDVVRASFGGQAAPFVAYTIERVGRMETGAPSTP